MTTSTKKAIYRSIIDVTLIMFITVVTTTITLKHHTEKHQTSAAPAPAPITLNHNIIAGHVHTATISMVFISDTNTYAVLAQFSNDQNTHLLYTTKNQKTALDFYNGVKDAYATAVLL